MNRINYARIAGLLFDRPLAIAEGKARVIVDALLPRIVPGAAGVQADIVDDDLAYRHRARGQPTIRTRDGVAVIEVVGALVQRGGWIGADSGLTSYQGLRTQIEEARDDESVRAIALEIDSPGGEVSGLFDLADVIRSAREVKPVRAFVADMAASAAYTLAAQASDVVVSRTGLVGSMGAIMVHYDLSAALEQAGVRPTIISAGKRKADFASEVPLADGALAWAQDEVDRARDLLAETVAAGRGARLDKAAALATEAGLFTGARAVAAGLADIVGDPAEEFRAWIAEISAARLAAPTAAARGAAMSVLTKAGEADTSAESRLSESTIRATEAEGSKSAVADAASDAAEDDADDDEDEDGIPSGDKGEQGSGGSAAAAERDRICAILESPEAEGREGLARHFALATDLSPEVARAALAEAAKEAGGAGDLGARMRGFDPAPVAGPSKGKASVLLDIVTSEMSN